MVDGVNFNPFTGKVFSTDEINQLDTNKDGVVSSSELKDNMSWLSSQSVDEEGDIAIGDENTDGVTGTGNTNSSSGTTGASDLTEELNAAVDQYIEAYMQQHPELSQAEKSSLITFIKTESAEYINTIATMSNSVVDTDAITAEMTAFLDTAVQQRAADITETNATLDNYKNNVDSNYEALSQYTDAADNDYVTGAEYEQMKEQATAYLLGTMLNGAEDTDFLASLNADYKNNSNYQAAMEAINTINSETDPVKVQEALEKAKSAIGNLIGTQNLDGTSKLNDAVIANDQKIADNEKAAQAAEYKEQLGQVVDQMVESYSNAGGNWYKNELPTEEDVDKYAAQLNNMMTAFLEEYTGDGTNIEREFRAFVNGAMADAEDVQEELGELTNTSSADKYTELKDVINSTGTYISDSEAEEIVNTASDFIINQLAQGISDIALLESVLPGYASNEKFVEAKSLLENISTSGTPAEDLEKVKQLINDMMKEVGAEKIADGVKNQKMPAITISDVDYEKFTSSIPGYDNGDSWETGRYRKSDSAKDAIQDLAKQQLEALKPQLMAMLKEQMGADYDEDKINSLLDDAIYQTINDFTESGFGTRKSGLLKRRGTVNIKEIVDAFLTKFQQLSANQAGETDPTKNPVDRESVMADTTLADAYQDKSSKTIKGLGEAKLEARTQLQIVATQLKSQLRSQLGSEYNSSTINDLVDQAILNTLNSLESVGSNKKGVFAKVFADIYRVNTADITNKFFDEFDKLYEEAQTKNAENNA